MIMEKIYKLKLHETREIQVGPEIYYATRVPGGWLYHLPRLDSGQMTTTFVPFNNEFQTTG